MLKTTLKFTAAFFAVCVVTSYFTMTHFLGDDVM